MKKTIKAVVGAVGAMFLAAPAHAGDLTLIRVDDSLLEIDRSLNLNQGQGDTGSDVVTQTGKVHNLEN